MADEVTRQRPPGHVDDCWRCRHWQMVTHAIVVRGATIGWCPMLASPMPTDAWCSLWDARPIPVVAIGAA